MKPQNNKEAELSELMDAYGTARRVLEEQAANLQEAQQRVTNEFRPGIYDALNAEAAAEVNLHNFIAANPALFEEQKTRRASWGTCGKRKQPGRVVCADTERAHDVLIAAGFTAATAVKRTITIVKSKLAEVPAAVMKKAGIEIADAGEEVHIKTNGAIDKFINQLRKDNSEDA